MNDTNNKTLIWDLPTRIFHWSIVALFAFQWFSIEVMDDWMPYHELGGYALLALIIFRIIWGFIGPEYARFKQFIYSPAEILNYAKGFFSSNSKSYSGHNPMGGLSVLLLLSLLMVQAVSGLFMTDDILFYGPYYSSVSDETQKLMSRLHHLSFDILIWLIGLHILVILFYVLFKKQALISAMFHGHKVNSEASGITSHKLLTAIVSLLVAGAIVYGLVDYFAPETVDFF